MTLTTVLSSQATAQVTSGAAETFRSRRFPPAHLEASKVRAIDGSAIFVLSSLGAPISLEVRRISTDTACT